MFRGLWLEHVTHSLPVVSLQAGRAHARYAGYVLEANAILHSFTKWNQDKVLISHTTCSVYLIFFSSQRFKNHQLAKSVLNEFVSNTLYLLPELIPISDLVSKSSFVY